LVDGQPVPGSAAEPVPKWAYVFMVACAAIPFVTGFGAVPAALGFGGAAGVMSIARDPSRSTGIRVAISAAITAVCWMGFAALVFALAAAKR
jgi:hypothetical protein